MAHIRKCAVCGSEYDYCPKCDETKPTFYLKYCSDNCNNISLILNKFAFNHLTKEEAAMELLKADLANLDKYSAKKQAMIADILSTVKTPNEVVSIEDTIESVPNNEVEIEEPKPALRYRKSTGRRK